jgi:ribose 5-phosphate isomerase
MHAAAAAAHGARRVVLGRELSLGDLRRIRAATDVELEVFVHGALCVSYSGQCFSSEAWGGRSANRGQCAQACRLAYDLVVDGADELTAALTLTKGGGGALLREKVVAAMGRRFVVIATEDKLVERLGDSFAVPVEVVPFAVGPVQRTLRSDGLDVGQRLGGDGSPYLTDNGNAILLVRIDGGLEDPEQFDVWVTMLPGVVTSGVFVDLATEALLGRPDGSVRHLTAPDTDR